MRSLSVRAREGGDLHAHPNVRTSRVLPEAKKILQKGGDILHGHDSKACQRVTGQSCWLHRWYQGRGTKITIFPLVERGGRIGQVLVHRWLPECYRQMQQGLTDPVVHQGVYKSRRTLLFRSYGSQGRLNKLMERKMCLNTYFRGISFPRTSRAWYPWHDIM